jgi:hypothetical protein
VQTTLTISLQALAERALVRLPIDCAVPDVTVLIDDKLTWLHSTSALLQTAAGAHVLTFRRAGYVDSVLPVDVEQGENESLHCGLHPLSPLPPALSAGLEIRMRGESGDATVDGQPFHVGAPVPFGRHHIRVTRPGFMTWSREVDLRAGQTRALDVALVAIRETEEPHDAGWQAQSTVGWVVGGIAVASGLAALTVYMIADRQFASWKKADDELSMLIQQPGPQTASAIENKAHSNDDHLKAVWALDDWTVGLAIGAGVLAVGSAVLLGSAPKRPEVDQPLSLRLRGSGVEMRAKF